MQVFKPVPLRASEKENSIQQTRNSRAMSSVNGFPPQYFHDHSFNPLLNPHHDHVFPYEQQLSFQSAYELPRSNMTGDLKHPAAHSTRNPTYDGTNHSIDFEKDMQFRM